MKINHIALWVSNLELMKQFYAKYFRGEPNTLYSNEKKQFRSHFLTFEDGCRLELMQRPDIGFIKDKGLSQQHGLTHIAFSVGSKEKVDEVTETLRVEGFKIIGEPRTTGDGYYESVVLDPESNQLEITI